MNAIHCYLREGDDCLEDATPFKTKGAALVAFAKCKVHHKQIVTFKAVCCGKDIETEAAPAGDRWDTLATCQHCGALYIKITIGDRVDALEY